MAATFNLGTPGMSGYILHFLLVALAVYFWRARAGRSFDQLLDDAHHHHIQVLVVCEGQPKGGTWREHNQWMAEQH